MLTREQNETLCRVGPGTPMGEFMRQFWVPALRSEALMADGAPVRVRLLGEDFVAFRATDGRVGLFAEGCPHRCTSLALARNEDNALTCIFHGWKMDVSGKVVDVPSEPPERRQEFAAKVRVAHYPVREAGKIVWAYLGKSEELPAFPNFNFNHLPPEQVLVGRAVLHSNWMNLLEGQLDSAHVGMLHRDSRTIRANPNASRRGDVTFDTSPRFDFQPRPYGFREAALRHTRDGQFYVRVREFVVPWYASVPAGAKDANRIFTIAVPIDDENSVHWDVFYNLTRPLTMPRQADSIPVLDSPDNFAGDFGNMDNRFKQDRRAMKEGSWAGFPTTRYEDFAAAVAQGVICDRSREYLGSSDTVIIRARRMLLDAATRYIKGERVFDFSQPIDWENVEPVDTVIPTPEAWRTLPRE